MGGAVSAITGGITDSIGGLFGGSSAAKDAEAAAEQQKQLLLQQQQTEEAKEQKLNAQRVAGLKSRLGGGFGDGDATG